MRSMFNAVAVVVDAYLDGILAAQKAMASRGAEVISKITPAIDEITDALENSALPSAILRMKNFQAEGMAAVAEYMPAIIEASQPLDEAGERLKAKWAELTTTEAEKADSAEDSVLTDMAASRRKRPAAERRSA